jgi:phage gp36-like protein
MRIGELLLKRGWVEWEPLALAIADHRATNARIVSFLVAKGDVDFDDASRALAEQHGCAAALRRHLENRQRDALREVPARLARQLCALPLGRLVDGTLIVCVRDPSDDVVAQLARVVDGVVALAVAPSKYLERLVHASYPPGTSGEMDILVEVEPPDDPELSFDLLDESEPARDPLDAMMSACKDIDELPWLLDVVMEYVSKRWSSALLVELRERRAVGLRGHGPKLRPAAVKTFVIDLDEPSLIRTAREERRVVELPPADWESPAEQTEAEATIATALAGNHLVAAPLTKGDAVTYVLVVGDPLGKDPEETSIDLGLLIEAVSEALARL